MQRLKLAASKIPIELMERLNRLTELTGLTQSAAIRQAIEYYLDNAELTGLSGLTAIEGHLKPSQPVTTDNPVNLRLTDIEARLAALESAAVTKSPKPNTTPIAAVATKSNTTPKSKKATSPNTKSNTTPKANTKKAPDAPAPAPAGALTTGELFEVLKSLGYPHTQKSLSRRLNKAIDTQQLPNDLVALGVRADWEAKAKGSKYSNQVRWLRLE